MTAELLKQKLVAKTPIFDLVNRKYKSEEQGEFNRSVVEMYNNAIAVLLYDTATQTVYVEKEFRAGINRETFSIPAGKINDGETPLGALAREVKEETGYTISDVDKFDTTFITAVNSSEGFTDEMVYVYIVSGDFTSEKQENQELDKDEYIEGGFTKYPEEMFNMDVTFSAPTYVALSTLLYKKQLADKDKLIQDLVVQIPDEEAEDGDFYVG
jgi:ADP-ribose pyrophosphatase